MCGIAGYLAFADRGVLDTSTLVAMRDAMRHRGPDGDGLWIAADRRVGLAHRRLSIIDLSPAAAQPFGSDDGRIQIVFNGEIYNHAELRRELVAAGVTSWRTDHSDTEVILRLFERQGIAALERLRGMFALAIWDTRTRELWLIRDRIGVKPLYWTRTSSRLLFASEIKALLCDPTVPRRVDPDALYDAMSFLTAPAPRTLFAGIFKLPAGCLLRITEDGSVEERRWWSPWRDVRPLEGESDGAIAERVLSMLRESVALRTVSDVPVGVLLSGGIDSTTNATLFAELVAARGGSLKTFTIGYSDSTTYANETTVARATAARLGAEHHERLLSREDLVAFVPEMIELQDEPIADPVCFPVHFVSRLAREQGVIVTQVGEGSDELFCGYDSWVRYLQLARMNRLPVAGLLRRPASAALSLLGRAEGAPAELLTRASRGEPIFWSGAEAFYDRTKRRLLAPEVLRAVGPRTSWSALEESHRRYHNEAWEQSDLNWMTTADLTLRLPELLLMRVDKMAMGVGVEGRVPFLDHRFVELALAIPTTVKRRSGIKKAILKQAVRGLVPDAIIDAPKQGFGVPIHEWLEGPLGRMMHASLERFAAHSGLVEPAAFRAEIPRLDGARRWYLFNIAAWWERWIA